MKLNEKIIKLRKERGLSQEELGNAINTSRQAVSKWEAEQTKPDIDKIKEIAQFFNVSFDYLLNDEIDEKIELKQEQVVESKNENTNAKIKKKHPILKTMIIILVIYFLICVYKFIALFRFYKIADSFSEENYSMYRETKRNGEIIFEYSTKKIGNKIINESTNSFAGEEALVNEFGETIPYDIEYIDQDKDICFKLTHLDDMDKWLYGDRRENAETEEDWNNIMCRDINLIKDFTLDLIPSDFKEILLYSINPFSSVSITKREICVNNLNKFKLRILLTQDCLIERYTWQSEFDGSMDINLSYNYVPEHFVGKEIENPIEKYKDKILNIEDINK